MLGPGDGCGDAFFWATNADDTIAVTVTVEQRERVATEPTTASYDVGDPGLTVTVLRGQDLSSTFCTDLLVGDPVDSRRLRPPPATSRSCSSRGTRLRRLRQHHGTATVTALEGDGLSFADVTVESAHIGCYAG